ncbi:MAG: hypothetical protein A2W99_05605 [Bacteroidetes bacterium GWF2_33_16]|nr:MAG: hypothetical protein A2X00_13290 [Bacteroidetes bacterium GWE2_32_14]OFY05164.1 MAG: hypothetical protein A2W99_05605 [Bacteroidetes bacterium GWF2_33_16]
MKTIKLKSKIYLLLFGIIFLSFYTQAQEKKDSFEKSFSINSTGDLTFSCYDTDLKVNTWAKNEVKLSGEIIIKGGEDDDQKILLDLFKNPEIIQGTNSLNIKTNLSKSTTQIGPFKRTTLVNGKTINIDKYTIKYTLWIPESIAFNLKSKYNKIEIATLKGKIDFDLYDADITMASFGDDAKLTMKYSNASIGNGGDAILNIYDSDIEALEMKNVEITSKYSEIIIGSANTLDLNSYDDDIIIQNINSLKSEAKYSDYRIKGDMSNCIINFYDSDIEAINIGTLVFSGKYSGIKAGNVNQFVVKSIYDSDVKLGDVGEFSCDESKYDYFVFGGIKKLIKMPNTYDSDLTISKVYPSFALFEGNFKYCSVIMPLDATINFSLEFETTYGEVKFPRERFSKKITSIKENSKYQFAGATSETPTCDIKFGAYDSNLVF